MQTSCALSFLHLISYDGKPGSVLGLPLAPITKDDVVQVPHHSMGASVPRVHPVKPQRPYTSRWYWGEKPLEYFESRGLRLIQKYEPAVS